MTVKRFAIYIRLREITHGKSRTRLHTTILRTDSNAAADHIMAQVCDYPANWSPMDEIRCCFDDFPAADKDILQQEGLAP